MSGPTWLRGVFDGGDPGLDPDDPGPASCDEVEPDERPTYVIRPGTAGATVARATAALAGAPGVYERGQQLVRVVRREDGYPIAWPLSPAGLRAMLSDLVRWENMKGPTDLSEAIVAAVHTAGQWPVPHLVAVSSTPPVRQDGTIAADPGFDAPTGIYYHGAPLESAAAKRISSATQLDAAAARHVLLDLVGDYHWADQADADGWLAGLLAPLVRSWCSPTPLTMITSTTAGSGKGLLVEVLCEILGGARPGYLGWWGEGHQADEEADKRILALAMSGEGMVVIDNAPRGSHIGGSALDRALTSERISGRVLGQSRIAAVPLRACWYATGNAIRPLGDTARRTVMCRLDPRCEHPELRDDFREPNLVAHVRGRRAELLEAALSIVVGYLRAGCPDTPHPPVGSYVAWSRVIRGAVIWAGGHDVADLMGAAILDADPEAEAHRILLAAWLCALPRGATAAQALVRADEADDDREAAEALSVALGEVCPGRGGAAIGTARQLSRVLRSLEGRIRTVGSEQLRLVRAPGAAPARWSVEVVE